MQTNKCKICRRLGLKLFLKGERCFSPKCSLLRKPYPPGQKRKKRAKTLSEYGKELLEKQKLKNLYGLKENQFKKYVKGALKSQGKDKDAASLLIKKLEMRLDNVIFRLGFAVSRTQSRQLITHGYFLINQKPVNTPSAQLKKGDEVSIKPQKQKKAVFQNLAVVLKKHQVPLWLKLDKKNLKGKILKEPVLEETASLAEISTIFEYYLR